EVFFVLVGQVLVQALSVFTQFSFHTFGGIRNIDGQTAVITEQQKPG
ncbi:unnamed protein product, partial [marine sediment metagenome]